MLKLARLHPAAAKLASAIAVLGAHADLPRVVKLGGVRSEESLVALDALRELYATGQKTLLPRAPTAFLKSAWRKLIGTGAAVDRRAYQVAVMMALRDRLRSGDIWVEGSRAFRAFDDFRVKSNKGT